MLTALVLAALILAVVYVIMKCEGHMSWPAAAVVMLLIAAVCVVCVLVTRAPVG